MLGFGIYYKYWILQCLGNPTLTGNSTCASMHLLSCPCPKIHFTSQPIIFCLFSQLTFLLCYPTVLFSLTLFPAWIDATIRHHAYSLYFCPYLNIFYRKNGTLKNTNVCKSQRSGRTRLLARILIGVNNKKHIR